MNDEFRTIAAPVRCEIRVQRSRFLAVASPVATPADVERFLGGIRKEFPDATHHCHAYRLGTDQQHFRFHDDGEPSGTAGRPILVAIDAVALTDVAVVVTRYFGGTKLGVGGLARAYGDAARRVLESAAIVMKYKTGFLETTFPHAYIGVVMHAVSTAGAKIIDTSYDEDVHLRIEVRLSKIDDFRSALIDQTNGNVSVKPVVA